MLWKKDIKKILSYLNEQYFSILEFSCISLILSNRTEFLKSELSRSLGIVYLKLRCSEPTLDLFW